MWVARPCGLSGSTTAWNNPPSRIGLSRPWAPRPCISQKDALLRLRIVPDRIGHCYELARDILKDAIDNGAQIISTACPMCQMNLEAYQKRMNKALGTNFNIPVVFITQLMAVAFGLSRKAAALDRLLISAGQVLKAA